MRDIPLRLLKSGSKPAKAQQHKNSTKLVEVRHFQSPACLQTSIQLRDTSFTPSTTRVICAVELEKLSKTDRAYHDAVGSDRHIQPDHLSKSAIMIETKPDLKPAPPGTPAPQLVGEEGHFCVCKRPYLHGDLMFKCEGYCGNWYHPKCLGMNDAEIEKHRKKEERWYCSDCYQHAYSLLIYCNLRTPVDSKLH